ncbi:hypothetical protein H0G86_006260 [Trichoderma simmonsii]|uniref:Uncharacterized protein n=1 Tax=Trichoderma simmonsii TaxID=1491479 RepID=A0A8G0LB58_9HYPO|nr:hypothetical protein H0G86_006260 [Trichoderma simmonsii]
MPQPEGFAEEMASSSHAEFPCTVEHPRYTAVLSTKYCKRKPLVLRFSGQQLANRAGLVPLQTPLFASFAPYDRPPADPMPKGSSHAPPCCIRAVNSRTRNES